MEESKTIARPYAKAVFDIALSNKQLKEKGLGIQNPTMMCVLDVEV